MGDMADYLIETGEDLCYDHIAGHPQRMDEFDSCPYCHEEEITMPEQFHIGDRVTWTSQSGGSAKIKGGTVVDVIPSKQTANPFISARQHTHVLMADGTTLPRDHESYLVEVVDGKTRRAKPRLYWPRVGSLRRTKEAGPLVYRSRNPAAQ